MEPFFPELMLLISAAPAGLSCGPARQHETTLSMSMSSPLCCSPDRRGGLSRKLGPWLSVSFRDHGPAPLVDQKALVLVS